MKNQAEQTSLRRGIFSVIIGLALAVLLQIGASQWVGAQNVQMESVVPFITKNVAAPMSKIGSLAVGSMMVPGWIYNLDAKCMVTPDMSDRIHSCLDVNGNSTFQKLWVTPPALLDMVVVTVLGQIPSEGGSGWDISFGPKFIIEDISGVTNDSMLISGLGRYSGGVFNPQDLSTLRNVCAAPNGTLVPCGGGPAPVDARCISYGTSYFMEQPATNTATGCSSGNYSDLPDTEDFWLWQCLGQNGGINANPCYAHR